MSPQKRALQRRALRRIASGKGVDFKVISSSRMGNLLDRWALAGNGRKLKPHWKVEMLTDPYLHKGNLGVVAITRPDGKLIYRARSGGEYPIENDKRHTRVRVDLHRLTHKSSTGAIRLNTQGVLAILEEVSISRRQVHGRTPEKIFSFDRLRAEAKRHAFDNEKNLVELVHHIVGNFGSELKYRRAIRDMVKDEAMHTHLRALNELAVHADDHTVLPHSVSAGLSTHLVPVLDYLEKKAKQFKKEK